jgi:hypothetical protein
MSPQFSNFLSFFRCAVSLSLSIADLFDWPLIRGGCDFAPIPTYAELALLLTFLDVFFFVFISILGFVWPVSLAIFLTDVDRW